MRFDRTIALIGQKQFDKIQNSRIMVLGLGGVGGHAAEALARLGIRKMILVDPDLVQESNINRQIVALTSTIGIPKTTVMAERIIDIDPGIEVIGICERISVQNANRFLELNPDIVVDCIDDVSAKTAVIMACQKQGVTVISAMGFANKLHPEQIRIGTLKTTSVCPLARAVRGAIRKEGGNLDLSVVYSVEPPITTADANTVLGSVSFVPAVAGLMLASLASNLIISKESPQ